MLTKKSKWTILSYQGGKMSSIDENKPARGDIVQFVDRGGEGEICIVIGWVDKDILRVKDIQSGKIITESFQDAFIVILKKDQYEKIVNDLPRTIEVTNTEP